jgi:hypothetical protein
MHGRVQREKRHSLKGGRGVEKDAKSQRLHEFDVHGGLDYSHNYRHGSSCWPYWLVPRTQRRPRSPQPLQTRQHRHRHPHRNLPLLVVRLPPNNRTLLRLPRLHRHESNVTSHHRLHKTPGIIRIEHLRLRRWQYLLRSIRAVTERRPAAQRPP